MIGVLSVLTMLACMVAFLLGLVVLAYPLKRIGMTRRWHGAAVAAGAFVLFMIAGLGLPPETTSIDQDGAPNSSGKASAAPAVVTVAEQPSTATMATADPAIVAAVAFENVISVSARLDGESGNPDYLRQVGGLVERLATALQAGARDAGAATATELDLVITSRAVDRLGGEHEVHVISLTFPVADLRAARLENLTRGRLLNLATDVRFGQYGANQLDAYCNEPRGARESDVFCNLAANLKD
ncbi:hypothetical protein GVN24_24565 [Rhizobium sp. CRIBSB]|nr:hypothetical protein [Rhizobium sp. CRIBSB]